MIIHIYAKVSVYNMYHIVRLDAPSDARFLYKWHQESYYTIPDANSLQVWAPLVEKSTKENGTVEVLVGSHEKEIQHRIERVRGGGMSRNISKIMILIKIIKC